MKQMKLAAGVLATIAALSMTGCASGLNSAQKAELREYEAKGVVVQEKNPTAGAALGLLPGGGSFYGREYGLGVVNLLFWPLSILWDPISGHDASEAINYHATKASLEKAHEEHLTVLDDDLAAGKIDLTQYTLEKHKLDMKFDVN